MGGETTITNPATLRLYSPEWEAYWSQRPEPDGSQPEFCQKWFGDFAIAIAIAEDAERRKRLGIPSKVDWGLDDDIREY